MKRLTGAGNRFNSCAAIMDKEREHLIIALKLYAAGINEIYKDYHAVVDLSGSTPQLSIRKR